MCESPTVSPSRYPHLNELIMRNLRSKLENFRSAPVQEGNKLRVVVYGEHVYSCFLMWNSIFRRGNVNFYYSAELDPIPFPLRYGPRMYKKYEGDARRFIFEYIHMRELHIIWDLYNVSTDAKYPRLHLLLANRRVKRSELGRWAHVDRPGFALSVQADRSSSQSSTGSHDGGGSGTGGISQSGSRELRRTDSGDSSGSRGTGESIAGCSSVGGSSANVSSDNNEAVSDSRFITIETLRTLVLSVLEGSQISTSARQTSGSSSSESTQTPRVRQSSRLLQRRAGLSFDSEDAPVAGSIEQTD